MFTNSFGLLVSGSRGISDYQSFADKLDHLLSEVEQWDIHIITGDAKGVDEMARRYAEERGYELHTFYAWWNEHGKTAGFNRNLSMFKFLIENFQHPGCFAMWDGQSHGTKHAINLAKYWKVPLRISTFKVLPKQKAKAPEKEFVSAPKWFQDDPDLSNYDKFLIRAEAENVPSNRDPRDEARDRTVYIEESDYLKRKKRKALLRRAAHLADLYDVWATPSWYE